jgi:hypothetical protein
LKIQNKILKTSALVAIIVQGISSLAFVIMCFLYLVMGTLFFDDPHARYWEFALAPVVAMLAIVSLYILTVLLFRKAHYFLSIAVFFLFCIIMAIINHFLTTMPSGSA